MDKLSDQVQNWITLNEPQCFILLGHLYGEHAPGLKMPVKDILAMAHHTFLAHGESVKVIRSCAKTRPHVGLAMVGTTFLPHTQSPDDIEAARQAIFGFNGRSHGLWSAGLWFDPMLFGHYPDAYYSTYQDLVPKIGSDDFQTMAQPIDFLGLNIYNSSQVQRGSDGKPEIVPYKAGCPEPISDGTLLLKAFTGPRSTMSPATIYITENGLANQDWVSLDGRCVRN